jgi:hypothetical protein
MAQRVLNRLIFSGLGVATVGFGLSECIYDGTSRYPWWSGFLGRSGSRAI